MAPAHDLGTQDNEVGRVGCLAGSDDAPACVAEQANVRRGMAE